MPPLLWCVVINKELLRVLGVCVCCVCVCVCVSLCVCVFVCACVCAHVCEGIRFRCLCGISYRLTLVGTLGCIVRHSLELWRAKMSETNVYIMCTSNYVHVCRGVFVAD